jgi:hypothetical protein
LRMATTAPIPVFIGYFGVLSTSRYYHVFPNDDRSLKLVIRLHIPSNVLSSTVIYPFSGGFFMLSVADLGPGRIRQKFFESFCHFHIENPISSKRIWGIRPGPYCIFEAPSSASIVKDIRSFPTVGIPLSFFFFDRCWELLRSLPASDNLSIPNVSDQHDEHGVGSCHGCHYRDFGIIYTEVCTSVTLQAFFVQHVYCSVADFFLPKNP